MNFSDSELLKNVLKTYYPDLSDTESALEAAFLNIMQGFPEDLKTRIKTARINSKLNQKQLASKLGITQGSYSGWETGAHIPKVENIKQLSDVLSVDPSVFISPKVSANTSSREIPIVSDSYFTNKSAEQFQECIKDPKNNGITAYKSVLTDQLHDFVFDLRQKYMEGNSGYFIPSHSLVFCNFHEIKNMDLREKLNYLNCKIAVVSMAGSSGMLREIRFDGNILTLQAWDKSVPNRIFPMDINVADSIENKRTYFARESDIILAKDVVIYGVATKFVKEL